MAKSPEPVQLSSVPNWDELKSNSQFLEWYASPFLRMMTAALRESFPASSAVDPHLIIHNAGELIGYLNGLKTVDTFCKQEQQDKRESKSIPYQHKNHEQE